MRITVLTMFPEMMVSLQNAPIVMHAIQKGILDLEIVDIKEFADGSFRHIDDSPYGGGAGMIMRCEPVLKALASYRTDNAWTVFPSPVGVPYDQAKAHVYAQKEHLILIAGHYEGIDARIYEDCDELVSMGDYVVSGGEYPCMVIADSVTRLLDGVIKKASTEDESFEGDLLEYPQYTRPADYEGRKVPDVLLSGNHAAIAAWRHEESLKVTKKNRPDLYEAYMHKKKGNS